MSGALEVGSIVRTPRGLLARVVGEDGQGRLRLTYLPIGDVALFPELVGVLDPDERRIAAGVFRGVPQPENAGDAPATENTGG